MRLSLIDQSPRAAGQSVEDALRASLLRAAAADRAGLHRVWFAEHHRHAAFVADRPLDLAAATLVTTESVRVGSGGVLVRPPPPG